MLPDPSPDPAADAPAPPRRRRRLAIAALAACALAVALLAAAGAAARRPAGRAWIAATIAREASRALGVEVRIGDAILDLLPPRLELRALAVGPHGAELVTLDAVEVAARLTALLAGDVVLDHVLADGIRIDATMPEQEPKAGAPAPWSRVVVRNLELRRVTVAHLGLPSGLAIAAHDAEASWSADSRGVVRAAVARVGSFAIRAPGAPEVAGTLQARGRRTRAGWEIGTLRASGAGWTVEGNGTVGDDGSVAASAHIGLDLAAADALLDLGAGLSGQATADVELSAGAAGLRCTAAVASPAVGAAGFAFSDLAARVAVTRDGVDAEILRGTFAGGAVSGTYALAPLAAPWRHRIALRARGLDLAAFLATLAVEPAGLAASGDAELELAWEGEAIGAGVGAAAVRLRPTAGDVPLAGGLRITLSGDGRLTFATDAATLAGAPLAWEGTLTLADWVPDWRFAGERLRPATIARLLAGWTGEPVLPPGLDAEIAGEMTLAGPFDDPTITARVAATSLCLDAAAVAAGEAAFTFRGGRLTVERARLELGGGRVDASGTLSVGDGTLAAEVAGEDVPIARLLALAGVDLPFAGTLAARGSVGGTLAAPRARLRLTAAAVAVGELVLGDGEAALAADGSALELTGLTLGPLAGAAAVDLDAGTARVDLALSALDLMPLSPLLAALAGGPLSGELHGAFPLAAPTGRATLRSDAGLEVELQLGERELHAAAARPGAWSAKATLERTAAGLAGEGRVEVSSLAALLRTLGRPGTLLDGSLAARSRVEIGPDGAVVLAGALERATLAIEGETLALAAPASFAVAGSAVRMERASFTGPRSRLALAYAQEADGGLDVRLDAALPLALLGLAFPESKPRGTLAVDIAVAGTAGAPVFSGGATVRDGALTLPGLPAALTDIAGGITLDGPGLRVDAVRLRMAGGDVTLSGRIRLDPEVELDLAVAAERVPWALLPRFRPVLSGELRVSGPLDRLTIGGDVAVVEAPFREQIDFNTLVLDQVFARERDVLPTGDAIAFNVAIHIPGTLDIDTLPLRLQGRGELRLVGTSERPGLIGRIDALPGGEVELNSQRYEIDLATIAFSQPDRIDPAFDVRVRGWVDNVEVTIALAGTMERFTPTFTSNPPLSETDILGLISTGQRGDEGDPESLSSAASQFVNGQLASAVSSRARSLLNVDQLRLDPAAATTTGEPTTRMTVAQQLTRTWTVSISSNLSSNREEAVRSVWRVGQGMLVEAMRNADGSYTAGVKWQRRY